MESSHPCVAQAEDASTPASWVFGCDWCIEPPNVLLSSPPETQELAYRRRFNLRKTPEDFVANRPGRGALADAAVDAVDSLPAGVLSVRKDGPGPNLDFAISAADGVDGRNRVPVGALLDAESMALLARLVSLPTVSQRAKLGGKAGQPLVKVVVVDSALVAPPS